MSTNFSVPEPTPQLIEVAERVKKERAANSDKVQAQDAALQSSL